MPDLDPSAYSFTVYAVPMLVTMAAILLLGVFDLLRDRITPTSISFFLVTLSVSIWLFAVSMQYLADERDTALLWARAGYLGIPFIASSTYHFTVTVLRINSRQRPFVWLVWLVAALFSALALGTDAVIAGVYRYSWGYYGAYGWLGLPFIGFFFTVLLASMWHYWSCYRATRPGKHKWRIGSLMIAFAVGYLGAVDFVAVYGIDLYPFGYLAILGFVVLAFRAIWTYRLDDITPALAAREIVDTMSDALLVLDAEGVVRVANRAASDLFGYSQEELLGRPIAETVGATPFAENLGDFVRTGKLPREEIEYHNRAGQERILWLSASMKLDRRERPVAAVAIVRDVTERKRAEEEIRGLNESLERRVAERTAQLRAANQELEQEIAERERAEQERARLLDLEQAARRRAEQESLRSAQLAEALDRALAEARLLNAISMAAAGQEDLGRILAAALDNLRLVIPFSGGSIALVENDELVVRAAVGPFAAQALGSKLPRGRGKAWEIVARGEPFISGDLQADGLKSTSPVRSFLGVPLIWGGRAFGMLEVDSTTVDAFEETDLDLLQKVAAALSGSIQLARLYRQAEEAVRAREVLLSVVSHDLRNLLTAVSTSGRLLRRFIMPEKLPESARITAGLNRIDTAVARMNGLIGELLDFARLQAGQPLDLYRQRTDLVAMARRVATEYQHGTERHRIEVRTGLGELYGLWDAPRLERVLDNLLANAIKYSPEGGDITVELEMDGGDGGWAVLTVRDQGIGIPAGDLPHIFGWFRRAGNVAGQISGTGIGLASVAQVVDQHGGSVAVESTEGAGSAFTIRLPLAPPAANGANGHAAGQPHANGKSTPPVPEPAGVEAGGQDRHDA